MAFGHGDPLQKIITSLTVISSPSYFHSTHILRTFSCRTFPGANKTNVAAVNGEILTCFELSEGKLSSKMWQINLDTMTYSEKSHNLQPFFESVTITDLVDIIGETAIFSGEISKKEPVTWVNLDLT
jgi:hypothetical protein